MKTAEKWIGITAMCFFTLMGLLLFVLPDREMSQLENRYLQKRPAFTSRSLLSGKWGRDVESWLIDQFPFREGWVGINSYFEYGLLGKRERNGIYIAGEELFTRIRQPGNALERNLQALERLKERTQMPLTVMAVPTATTALSHRLPPRAPYYDERQTVSLMQERLGEDLVLDLYGDLAAQVDEQKLYFRLDHHWTMDGAYIGYEALMKRMGMEPLEKDSFRRVEVTDSFYGTAYAKVGLWGLEPEAIEVLIPEEGYSAVMAAGGRDGLSMFDEEKLLQYDKYAYFLGGNQPLNIIDSGLETGRRLVVIKDSYAHIMTPLLSLHFDQVILIDPRYVNADPYELIESFDPTELLVLMNGDNMGQENGLSLFLRY